YLFCEGFFKTKIKIKIILLSSFWILILITLSHYGWDRVVYAFVVFIFMVSFFYCLYDMLREQLCFLLPKADINRSKNSVPLPLAGSVLYLSDYGLTKRQIQLINDILETSATYTELGDKYYASTSTIKKDMSRIHKIFGVQNRENLKILLLQYKITQKRY
ncbi:MAG TPA: helix-turn-helix transcriptional regulator, partial [Treponemataceae bacterium]|nr:helix-turn-helix transcriptional regulator [Treponemataceae bacterium]